MSVYIIAQLKFNQREIYDRYQSRFFDVFKNFNGKLLVADEHPVLLEGEWPRDKVVIMEFPDAESATEFHEFAGVPGDRGGPQGRRGYGVVLTVRGFEVGLASAELRLALFDKRGASFQRIRARSYLRLHLDLAAELRGIGRVLALLQQHAGGDQRARRALRQALREATAASISLPSSTTSRTSPHSLARSADSGSLNSISSSARWRPTSRGNSQVEPRSGTSAMRLNTWMKLAERAATIMSPAIARQKPPPAATPLTATTTGTRHSRSALKAGQ